MAVFGGFIAGLLFAAWGTGTGVDLVPNEFNVYWGGLALAATGMLLVGLFDDIWGLSFYWKFAAQITAAVFVWSLRFSHRDPDPSRWAARSTWGCCRSPDRPVDRGHHQRGEPDRRAGRTGHGHRPDHGSLRSPTIAFVRDASWA